MSYNLDDLLASLESDTGMQKQASSQKLEPVATSLEAVLVKKAGVDLIKEAHQLYDIDRKEEYQEKYNYLDTYLKQNTSSNGKPKTDKSDTRKISQAVSRSIKNAIDEINAPCPDLAEYLTAYISKGKECQYKPVLSTKWSF